MDYCSDETANSAPLTVETKPFGPTQRVIDRVRDGLAERPEIQEWLQETEHRLLAFELVDDPRRLDRTLRPDSYRATYYDNTNNRSGIVEGRLTSQDQPTASESSVHSRPSADEFEDAVEILSEDPTVRCTLQQHILQPYPTMPPILEDELPDGRIERILAVGLLPAEGHGPGRHGRDCMSNHGHELGRVGVTNRVPHSAEDASTVGGR
jgi:hypothetical protein